MGVLLGIWAGCERLSAADLWQIGTFDESSAEFSPIVDPATGRRRIDYADPAQDPVFRVGRSDPGRDWFSYQPGTSNGGAGFRPHPFTVEFELSEVPRERVRLTLALLAYSTRLPVVELTVNGRTGRFHQQPRLAYSAGDPGVFFLPHYATARLEVDLPVEALRAGANRIVLTAVDEPGERDDVRPSGFAWPGCSGIVYDALRLEIRPDPTPAARPAETVRVEPTIYFKRIRGRLHEEVEVTVGATEVAPVAAFRLVVGDWRSERVPMRSAVFGETRGVFDVPEFGAGTPARVELECADRTWSRAVTLDPRRKWELLVVPNEHLDIGYTDFDWRVSELQVRTVETAIDLIRTNRGFHFTFDGFWILQEFLAHRDPRARAGLEAALRSGRLHVPAVYGSTFTGFAGLENLIRGLYPSARFGRERGVPIDCALITDVPSYSWSLASVLSAAGIRHLVAASDAYRAPFLLRNRFHETSPHAWQGPDGGTVVTWYSRHYHQVASLFGMPPQWNQGRESLPRFLQAYEHAGYKARSVILYGTQVENTALHPAQARFVEEWNGRLAYPHLRYAGFGEALRRIESESGGALPVHRGDGGPYWEDGLGANARITAQARANMQRVLAAEIFGSVGRAWNPAVTPDRDRLERIWRNLLLTDEHTWHADQSVRDPESEQSRVQGAVKDGRTLRAAELIREHLGQSLASLSHDLGHAAGSVVLFNPLSWARRGLVEMDLPRGMGLFDPEAGREVGHQTLGEGNGFVRVRFQSPEIPPVGYRALRIRAATHAQRAGGPTLATSVLENAFYRIELDAEAGAIRRIRDKVAGRELVDPASPYRFGQHLHVTGADALPNRLVQFSSVHPEPSLRIHPAGGGRVVAVEQLPFGWQAVLESTNHLTSRIQTEVLLHADTPRIDLTVRLVKEKSYAKEGVYLAFPFAFEEPRYRYATANGFVDPSRDLLPGAGFEWFCIQQWLALEQDGLCAILAPADAPLVTVGDIARGRWPEAFGRRNGTVFSYLLNNYTPEGYAAGQGGEFVFRYTIASRPGFDPVAAHRLGAETLSPVEQDLPHRNDRATVVANGTAAGAGSFLRIDRPEVSLVTWKTAEEGGDSILRFVETGGVSNRVAVTVETPARIRSAWACDALERWRARIAVDGNTLHFDAVPFGIHTVRVRWRD